MLQNIRKEIKKRIKELEEEKVQNLIENIEKTNEDSHKMYKAIHALKTIGKSAHTKVKDEKGN